VQRVNTSGVVLSAAMGVWPGKRLGQAFGAVSAMQGVVSCDVLLGASSA